VPRYLVSGVVVASIVFGALVLPQKNTPADRLWVRLANTDVDAKTVLEDYAMVVTQPIARGAFEDVQKVEGVVQARFNGYRRIAEARMQSDADGRPRTAQLHLAAGLKAAKP